MIESESAPSTELLIDSIFNESINHFSIHPMEEFKINESELIVVSKPSLSFPMEEFALEDKLGEEANFKIKENQMKISAPKRRKLKMHDAASKEEEIIVKIFETQLKKQNVFLKNRQG